MQMILPDFFAIDPVLLGPVPPPPMRPRELTGGGPITELNDAVINTSARMPLGMTWETQISNRLYPDI